MANSTLNQGHHIIEQAAARNHRLLQELTKMGLFDLESPRNIINLPADVNLAKTLGISPHNGGPLSSYTDGLEAELTKLQNTVDGKAAIKGDLAAGKRIAGKVDYLRDGMRAALETGDLLTNTPSGWKQEAANAHIKKFFAEITTFRRGYVGRIQEYSKMTAVELKWSAYLTNGKAVTTLGAFPVRVQPTLEALLTADVSKVAKGAALDAFEEFVGALAIHLKGAPLPAPIDAKITTVYSKVVSGAKVLGVAGLLLDITASTAEAAAQNKSGKPEDAALTMAKLAARLTFGWKGAAIGATWGAIGGPLGIAIGAFVGGIAGSIAGDFAIDGIAALAETLKGAIDKAVNPPKTSDTASNGKNTSDSVTGDSGRSRDRESDHDYTGTAKEKSKKEPVTVSFPNNGKTSSGKQPPILLDIGRDGHIDFRPFDVAAFEAGQGPRFDWDDDGIADGTAWVGPADGWLAIDIAADGGVGPDGVIDQAKELAFTMWKTPAELAGEQITDLEAVRLVFDTNHNNLLDPGDTRWGEFRVWQDANQNGISEAGELRTLVEADIRLIELVPTSDGARQFADGSAITGTSSYFKGDGSRALVADATIAYRKTQPATAVF